MLGTRGGRQLLAGITMGSRRRLVTHHKFAGRQPLGSSYPVVRSKDGIYHERSTGTG